MTSRDDDDGDDILWSVITLASHDDGTNDDDDDDDTNDDDDGDGTNDDDDGDDTIPVAIVVPPQWDQVGSEVWTNAALQKGPEQVSGIFLWNSFGNKISPKRIFSKVNFSAFHSMYDVETPLCSARWTFVDHHHFPFFFTTYIQKRITSADSAFQY